MTAVWIAFGLALIAWAALTYIRLRRLLHILQLEEYFTQQFLRWLQQNWRRYLTLRALTAAIVAAGTALIVANTGVSEGLAAGWLVLWGAWAGVVWSRRTTPPKKPLVMTARAWRLLLAGLALSGAIVVVTLGLGLLVNARAAIAAGVVATVTVSTFGGHVLVLANLLLWPLEELSRRRFQKMAEARLTQQRPRIIAITGSAGKTTTKELVAHLLSARYRVLKTPASFNTPMGLARTVNSSLDGQEYFVVEMGAYKRGEIEKLCRLVGGTDISVITTVNAQHLERFGSLEATAEAKFEIVGGLKEGGTAVLNFDVPAVRERALRFGGVQVLSFGVESEDVDLRAENVSETEGGIEFDVTYRAERTRVLTALLARHNAVNVLAALGVGLSCGLDVAYMASAIRHFRPPEHRLQPADFGNGVTVLDDAYNANPEGIIGALEVLGRYAPRRRIVVTPGLIEMGREKAAYHQRIGQAAAANVDVALLVGPRQTADIRDAMLAASFPEGTVHVVRSLGEAQDVLSRIGAPGDVILYANDLPDQYDEFLVI